MAGPHDSFELAREERRGVGVDVIIGTVAFALATGAAIGATRVGWMWFVVVVGVAGMVWSVVRFVRRLERVQARAAALEGRTRVSRRFGMSRAGLTSLIVGLVSGFAVLVSLQNIAWGFRSFRGDWTGPLHVQARGNSSVLFEFDVAVAWTYLVPPLVILVMAVLAVFTILVLKVQRDGRRAAAEGAALRNRAPRS